MTKISEILNFTIKFKLVDDEKVIYENIQEADSIILKSIYF